MLEKIHALLKKADHGSIALRDIDWRKVGYKIRQIAAIIPRVIALPFFLVSLILVLTAILPGQLADKLQRLADKVAR